MSHFDEWIEDYFSQEDAHKIGTIGCWSYTSSSKKSPKQIRESLTDLGMSRETIDEFVEGVFHTKSTLSLVTHYLSDAEKSLRRLADDDDEVDTESVAAELPEIGKRLEELKELEMVLKSRLHK